MHLKYCNWRGRSSLCVCLFADVLFCSCPQFSRFKCDWTRAHTHSLFWTLVTVQWSFTNLKCLFRFCRTGTCLMRVCSWTEIEAVKLARLVFNKLCETCCVWLKGFPPRRRSQAYYETSIHAIKNMRRKMEDRHVIIPDFNTLFNLQVTAPHTHDPKSLHNTKTNYDGS